MGLSLGLFDLLVSFAKMKWKEKNEKEGIIKKKKRKKEKEKSKGENERKKRKRRKWGSILDKRGGVKMRSTSRFSADTHFC
jgi:hypothetical protein